MDRNLIDYLPPVLRSVREFIAVTDAQQPEIEQAWAALDLVMDNQFLESATEEGVAMWEKELAIMPLQTDTLEQRKQRIKAAWTYGVVYTYRWLIGWLQAACGANNPAPVLDDYVLRTYLPISSDYMRILEDMRRYISANVLIDPRILLTRTSFTHYTGAAFRRSARQSMKTSSWDTEHITLLTDENGAVLLEDSGKVLYEEVNP